MNRKLVTRSAWATAVWISMGATAVHASSRHAVATAEVDAVAAQPAADPQAKDDLLEGIERLGANAKERNEVNLDKNTMALAAGRKGGRYGDLAQKMDFISVRNYEFAAKGQYRKSDLDNLRRRLDSHGWSHLVRNENEGETNDICIRTDPDGTVREMVILNAEARELNIVHLRGHFRMEDVQGAVGMTRGVGAGSLGMSYGHGHGSSSASASNPAAPAPPVPPADAASGRR